jgi:Protein of unknown function (DUF3348)
VPPRTAFHSPPLVRLLAGLDTAEAPVATRPQSSVGERLGAWLDWTDAIALSQALNQTPAWSPPATPAARRAGALGAAALARVRDDLSRAILQDPVLAPDGSQAPDAAPDQADIRRAAQARQRAMAAAISPLRAQLRGLLATTSPAGAHLAALDATLEAALAEQERHHLAAVVQRLERHFQQARAAAAADWHTRVLHTVRQVLLAELDLRLQPAQGLLDAINAVDPQGDAA